MPELRFGGGINNLDDELINPEECVDGENFLLNAESLQFLRRPAFDLKGTAPNGDPVRSIMQLINRNDTTTTLIKAGTTVYSWNLSSTFTPVTTVGTNALLRDSYWSLDDLLIITDLTKATVVSTWDGSSFGALTHGIAGVTNLYAKYSVVYQNRVWLFNVKTDSTDLPHVILASEFNEHDNYDNSVTPTSTTLTKSAPFFLAIADLKPINGVAVFFDTIVISTVNGKIFALSGTDATNYSVEEFYPGSGANGQEMIANIGNDVIYAKTGGQIERLKSSDSFGDTQADDLSRWIQNETTTNNGIVVYDQTHQRVYFFYNAKILVLDKYHVDINSGLSPWMKWTTQMLSDLQVEAAKAVRDSTGRHTVYFGGPEGQIYDINGTGASDPGSTLIKAYRKSKLINELFSEDDYVTGRVHYRRRGECTLNMAFEWSDNYADSRCSVPLKGPIVSMGTTFWGGDHYFGEDIYWGAGGVQEFRVSTVGFSAVGKSPSFFLTLSINAAVDFLVNKITTEE